MFPRTAQKMKCSIKDFFSKCDQIRCKLRIWSQLLDKSFMKNFIFCAVPYAQPAFTCSKSIMERSEQCVKSAQSLQNSKAVFHKGYLVFLEYLVPHVFPRATRKFCILTEYINLQFYKFLSLTVEFPFDELLICFIFPKLYRNCCV